MRNIAFVYCLADRPIHSRSARTGLRSRVASLAEGAGWKPPGQAGKYSRPQQTLIMVKTHFRLIKTLQMTVGRLYDGVSGARSEGSAIGGQHEEGYQ
jgi:hypothetical protein